MSRRRLIVGAVAGLVGASLVEVQTAYAAQIMDCPVYMFHETTATNVASIIQANLDVRRRPIRVDQLVSILLGDAPVPKDPAFCLTFDDGYLSQYRQIAPVLDRYNAKATFCVMATLWRGDGVHTYMVGENIQDLAARGHEIASHTINHATLTTLRATNKNAYLAEVFQSQSLLQDLTQTPIPTFCYPNGAYNGVIMDEVSTAYRGALTTKAGRTQFASNVLALTRERR